MTKIETVKQVLAKHKSDLRKDYHVKTIGLFGSYVRREARKESDLDVLVEFSKPIGLLRFGSLEDYLSLITGIKVDLVMRSALKPALGKNILREVVYV